ncbi:MAG TPA: inositol monophosphatase family protein [Aurantimonas sp.]|uniref:3'(2'),5'-bisphosphate nucleotidase CysQ n=1 Tax=Aurantimonas marianensis TaxID=2920428 RepID=A0A9X2KF20_9HYPH|nr:inositol monophosphatase family protein [Aurantimonas marianensis]MCP3055016.1 3'(2'),5'-bisphosphate nucleotidase CysQ [Aurantimonas marianensis]
MTASVDTGLLVAAVRAGMAAIVERGPGPAGVDYKDDASPVTEADRAAEHAITALIEAACSVPILAEERFSAGEIPAVGRAFLLVDPLDGTKSYIAGKPDYTVNVALIEDGMPVFGCVGVPATGELYCGGRDRSATVERDGVLLTLRGRRPGPRLDVVASRDHLSDATRHYIAGLDLGQRRSVGSSLKFCLLAEGGADIYPCLGRTMQWDTAAGDAVLRAAGGLTARLDGSPLRYGRTGRPDEDIFANPHFIAVADPQVLARPGVILRTGS